MNWLGRWLSAITWLLVAGSIVVLAGGLMGRPLLLAAVPTGSMVPVFLPGDMIVVLPTWLTDEVGQGDIIVYQTEKDQRWIVHRIVGGSEYDGFITKGDANPVPDLGRVPLQRVAGLVPQLAGRALRLPRLGLLSLVEGPFSSPVVAVVALVMGVYLLVLDARPRVSDVRRRVSRVARPDAVFSMYLGLAGTVFLTTLIPAWTLSSNDSVHYEVVMSRPANVRPSRQYLAGRTYTEPVPIENPSLLPLVITFSTTDPRVRYEPAWAVIGPKGRHTFTATIEAQEAGTVDTRVHMGVFLPLLPPPALALLTRFNTALAALATALVPSALLLCLAFFDARSRMALVRLRTALAARVGF